MAQAWFYNIPFHGHINPTLPLVQELVRRGDDVTYYAGPGFEEKIMATGARYGSYGDGYTFESSRSVAHAIHQGGELAEAAAALLQPVLTAVAETPPDYILFDMSAPWGRIAARQHGIPAIASFPHLPFQWRTFFSDPRVLRKGLQSIEPGHGHYRRLQRETGRLALKHRLRRAEDINILSSTAALNIVFSSRYFQPFDEHFDDSYLYIGPVINTERTDEPMPIDRRPGQQLIYIAVGTVYAAQKQFFEQCLEAFGDGRYAVVMSVGKAVDPADLGPLPETFTVAQYVPQLAVLEEADLFVTHGGMNSINEAVMGLVPLIVVPNTIEQTVNAARVEQLEGGLYLEPDRLTTVSLRQAAERVLGDPAYTRGLERIRASFLAGGGVARAADAIAAFKNERGIL